MTTSIQWDEEPDLGELNRLHALLKRNPAQAVSGLESLSDRGSAASAWYLANHFLEQDQRSGSVGNAVLWLERAERSGIVQATHILGRMFAEKGDNKTAFSKFRAASDRGYLPSHYRLALIYKSGLGIEPDWEKYKELLSLAASGGHLFAKRDMMALCLSGKLGASQVPRGASIMLSLAVDLVRLKFWSDEERENRVIC